MNGCLYLFTCLFKTKFVHFFVTIPLRKLKLEFSIKNIVNIHQEKNHWRCCYAFSCFQLVKLNKLVHLVKGYLTRMWQYPFPFNCYVALSSSRMDLEEHTSLSRTRFVWKPHNILSLSCHMYQNFTWLHFSIHKSMNKLKRSMCKVNVRLGHSPNKGPKMKQQVNTT